MEHRRGGKREMKGSSEAPGGPDNLQWPRSSTKMEKGEGKKKLTATKGRQRRRKTGGRNLTGGWPTALPQTSERHGWDMGHVAATSSFTAKMKGISVILCAMWFSVQKLKFRAGKFCLNSCPNLKGPKNIYPKKWVPKIIIPNFDEPFSNFFTFLPSARTWGDQWFSCLGFVSEHI